MGLEKQKSGHGQGRGLGGGGGGGKKKAPARVTAADTFQLKQRENPFFMRRLAMA